MAVPTLTSVSPSIGPASGGDLVRLWGTDFGDHVAVGCGGRRSALVVAVLTGPVVMSSCEAVLLMMKQVPGAVLVGAASQGASGNPKPHDLKNGVTVFLPSWKAMTSDGHEFEGEGIAPDIEVQAAPCDFATSDPVLDAALAQIEKNFGKGSIMRLGKNEMPVEIESIPTGSLGLDIALGIGGLPRGRVVVIYGPGTSG